MARRFGSTRRPDISATRTVQHAIMQNFFLRPRKCFNGCSWTIQIGFRTIAGPFRFGIDAEQAISKLGVGRAVSQ